MADYVYPTGLGPMSTIDVANLRNAAENQYKFLNNNAYNMTYTGPKNRDGTYLEAWNKGDEGDRNWPRDKNLPVNAVGIEIMRPDVTPSDIAADMLSHIDKNGQSYNTQLSQSLVPSQVSQLKKDAEDYKMSKQMGLGEKQSLQNAYSSLFRAGVFGQWGPNGLDKMYLNPSQQNIINQAKGYSVSGTIPSKGLYDIRAALGIGSAGK
jgi:hypothetical protein